MSALSVLRIEMRVANLSVSTGATQEADVPTAPSDTGVSHLLLLAFFGSGCASLIYEVVWFQLLQLVIGSSAVSLGVLLATFMGGTCLGSLLAPKLAGWKRNPLQLYSLLELGIGISGLLLLGVIPFLGDIYTRFGGGQVTVRAAIAGLCLLPPTMAMGATLPMMARWLSSAPVRAIGLGWFYTANLSGGIVGTLFAGFYLLRVFDVNVATGFAAALNAVMALAAWKASRTFPDSVAVPRRDSGSETRSRTGTIYLTIGLSGLTALSAQVLWTRLLTLTFGATTYAFSLVLTAFLSGLGIGSGLGTIVSRRSGARPGVLLGWCQILLVVAIAWGAYLLTEVMPYWPIADTTATGPWSPLSQDLLRTLAVVTPGAILWGASFPLALAAVATPSRDFVRQTAGIAASNTLGALIGSLGTTVLLAYAWDTQHIERLLISAAAVAGIVALNSANAGVPAKSVQRFVEWAAIAISAMVLAFGVTAVPGVLIAFGRGAAEWAATSQYSDTGRILYQAEGVNEFVAVSRGSGGDLTFHAAGKVQASTFAPDMRLQLLLAHLSHLVPRHPSEVLVIGCGAGITAGALSAAPNVAHITIAEIEPQVIQAAARYFGLYNRNVLHNPRVSIRIDDGRHFLATTDGTFDVITTDLTDPWIKGVAALFTAEFFESAKRHLRPGGVVTQFVQLYQSNREAVKSEIGTFVEAFLNAVVWGNPRDGEGYDLVLLGQKERVRVDVDEIQARLNTPVYADVAESLRGAGIVSAIDLLKSYAVSGPELRDWLKGAQINRDRNLRLQYLAGLGVGLDESGPIYSEILQAAKFPNEMFQASPATLTALRDAIRTGWRATTER